MVLYTARIQLEPRPLRLSIGGVNVTETITNFTDFLLVWTLLCSDWTFNYSSYNLENLPEIYLVLCGLDANDSQRLLSLATTNEFQSQTTTLLFLAILHPVKTLYRMSHPHRRRQSIHNLISYLCSEAEASSPCEPG